MLGRCYSALEILAAWKQARGLSLREGVHSKHVDCPFVVFRMFIDVGRQALKLAGANDLRGVSMPLSGLDIRMMSLIAVVVVRHCCRHSMRCLDEWDAVATSAASFHRRGATSKEELQTMLDAEAAILWANQI